jgi:hypothetical protein
MRTRLIALALLLFVLLAGGVVLAQGGLRTVAFTFSPGGVSTGDGYTISATAGQAAAGELTGDGYSLVSGFSGAPTQGQDQLFLPILDR